jgi:hypothetical protein
MDRDAATLGAGRAILETPTVRAATGPGAGGRAPVMCCTPSPAAAKVPGDTTPGRKTEWTR